MSIIQRDKALDKNTNIFMKRKFTTGMKIAKYIPRLCHHLNGSNPLTSIISTLHHHHLSHLFLSEKYVFLCFLNHSLIFDYTFHEATRNRDKDIRKLLKGLKANPTGITPLHLSFNKNASMIQLVLGSNPALLIPEI